MYTPGGYKTRCAADDPAYPDPQDIGREPGDVALQGFIHGMAASSMGHSAGFIAGLTVATLAIAAVAGAVSRRFGFRALAQ